MPEIPIFDSLTHPMPDGSWLDPRFDGRNTGAALREEMEQYQVPAVLAVGMGPKIGGYREEAYPDFVRTEIPGAHPIAFFDFPERESETSLRSRLEKIAALGFQGIKIHPRLASIDYTHPNLPTAIAMADQLSLPVLLCTYNYEKGRPCAGNALDDLLALIRPNGEAKIVLLHGGVFHALELSEMIRPYPNVLLDLSFTLCRFAGSSLDLDIRYLFHHFDRRLCVGSDSPEFGLAELRQRFDHFSDGLSEEKSRNIAHGNLQRLFGLQ